MTSTLTISERAGGSAPFPEVVTPDYRRVLRLEMSGGSHLALAATLEFTITAADFDASTEMCIDGAC